MKDVEALKAKLKETRVQEQPLRARRRILLKELSDIRHRLRFSGHAKRLLLLAIGQAMPPMAMDNNQDIEEVLTEVRRCDGCRRKFNKRGMRSAMRRNADGCTYCYSCAIAATNGDHMKLWGPNKEWDWVEVFGE